MREELKTKGTLAQEAAYQLGLLGRKEKDAALMQMAEDLEKNSESVLAANDRDMKNA